MRVACILVSGQDRDVSVRKLAEACFRFTPQVAVRGEEAVFLEIGRCRNLYTEQGLKLRLESLCARFFGEKASRVRIGFAADPAEALARARYGEGLLPLQSLKDFVSPFRFDEALEKKLSETIFRLRQLGIQTVQDFLEIPVHGLVPRFGREVMEIRARLEGEFPTAWPEFRPSPRVFEKEETEESDLESLTFVLKKLVDRSLARLWARSERASVVQVRFDLEKWSTLKSHAREFRLELPLPQGSTLGIVPILTERLRYELDRRGLEAPVTAVTFEILESVPGKGAQKDFFNRKEEETEVLHALVGRLSYKLGKDRVFVALPVDRYLPEKAWERGGVESPKNYNVRKIPTLAGSHVVRRPARILRRPERLERSGDWLVHPHKRWRVVKWYGPERLSGEWWAEPFQRDYYRVVAETGDQLWVYADGAKQELYLHGYFD